MTAYRLIPAVATRWLLESNPAVLAALGTTGKPDSRVYEGVLPPEFAASQSAPKAVLVRETESAPSRHAPLLTATLEIRCFGADRVEALAVYTVVAGALDNLENVSVSPAPNTASLRVVGAGKDQIDPDTGWVYFLFTVAGVFTNQ